MPARETRTHEDAKPKFMSTQVSDVRYYWLDPHPAATSGLAVVCGGRERCNADYTIDRRRFPYHSIEFVAGGRGELTLDGRRHPLHAGMAFHYGPRTPHRIRTQADDPMLKYFVDFQGDEAAALLRAGPLRGGVVQIPAAGELLSVFEDLQLHGSRAGPWSAPVCAALVRLLIAKIGALAVPGGELDSRALANYLRCRNLIDAHFDSLHTLADIARAGHVDPAYLCRLFRRFDHLSPYRYLVRRKMNRAAELLMASDLLIKQVAEELGYADPYHFSRVFKSVHHVAPAHFAQGAHRGT